MRWFLLSQIPLYVLGVSLLLWIWSNPVPEMLSVVLLAGWMALVFLVALWQGRSRDPR
jgi:hypothetical protein